MVDYKNLKSTCPFCEVINTHTGDPFYLTITCYNCQHSYFHVWCNVCNQVIQLKGELKNCYINHDNKRMKLRECTRCQKFNLYDIKTNSSLYCTCGNNIEAPDFNKQLAQLDFFNCQNFFPSTLYPIDRKYNWPKQRLEKDIICSLNEIYNGTQKKYKINGKLFEVPIRKSLKENSKITFEDEKLGENFYDIYDVIFTIKYDLPERSHIENYNIIYSFDKKSYKIDKKYKLTVTTPSGKDEEIIIQYNDFNNEWRLSGKSFWNPKKNLHGDIIIKFV